MKDRSIYIILGIMVVGAIALATGLTRVDNPNWDAPSTAGNQSSTSAGDRSRNVTVSAEQASSAEIRLEQPAGVLTVEPSDVSLMDAEFDTPGDWLPAVERTDAGEVATVKVTQDSRPWPSIGNRSNDWRVLVTRSMPLRLFVERGAGEALLDLRGVDVESLDARLGAGQTTVDLSGPRDRDVSVRVEAGVGEITLKVPSETGVRIVAEKGIGEITAEGLLQQRGAWVNSAYGQGPTMEVDLRQGVGAIRIIAVP